MRYHWTTKASVFIDYEKCFDKIDRSYLWQKLLTQNISWKFVREGSSCNILAQHVRTEYVFISLPSTADVVITLLKRELSFYTIKQRIIDMYCQKWYAEINNYRTVSSSIILNKKNT